MDATYRGWNFGAVAIKDHLSGRVVWFKFIDRKEKIEDYVEGVQWLENKRVEILGIVSDGLRGLRERLFRYKFQFCRFHQVKTVKHRLTSRPKLEASRELLDMVYFMSKTDKASFVGLCKSFSVNSCAKSGFFHLLPGQVSFAFHPFVVLFHQQRPYETFAGFRIREHADDFCSFLDFLVQPFDTV